MLDAVFTNSTEAIVIVDDVGRITYMTEAATRLVGHDADTTIGWQIFDFLHADDVDAAAQLFTRRLEYDGVDLGHEIRVRHATGEWIATLATAALLPDTDLGVCAITLRSADPDRHVGLSLRSRIVVGEYANRLSAAFMEATHSTAVLECIQRSLGEIGLLTGAEIVEVLLEGRDQASIERLARWTSLPGLVAGDNLLTGGGVRDVVAPLLSDEVWVDDSSGIRGSVAARFMRDAGAFSLLSAPFAVGSQRGVVALMRVDPGPRWIGADAELVRSVSGLFGRALHTARSEELLALTYREGPMGFSIRTWNGELVDCNEQYLDLYQLTREAAERLTLADLLQPEQRALVDQQLGRLRRGEIERFRAHVQLVRGDGALFWAQTSSVPLSVPGSSEQLVLTAVEDVTETYSQRLELEHAASHDSLTGVANRASMTETIDRLAAERGELPALVMIDLDRFKVVNDTHGHVIGDRVLCAVAERISSQVRSVDLVARLGGDEFAIVVPDLTTDGADALAARLRIALRTPLEIDGRSLAQTISVGVALGEGSTDPSDLLVHADRALYAAKANGRDGHVVFDSSLRDAVLASLAFERELRLAIESDRMEVHFQPEFAIDDGRIVGAEALLRWEHPERGRIPADEFIAIAEHCGLIDELGRLALRVACESFAQIGRRDLTLRVNISAREFSRPELPDLVRAALADSGLEPHRLCLEMTETTLMDAPEVALETVTLLSAIGVQSAIDDFGTGYSSLAYLKRFPVDAVKIDRAFVEDVVSNPESRAIVESIMGLSDALTLDAVAEGVETLEQLEILRELGVERAQGFLVSGALPMDEFVRFLARDRSVWPPTPTLHPVG